MNRAALRQSQADAIRDARREAVRDVRYRSRLCRQGCALTGRIETLEFCREPYGPYGKRCALKGLAEAGKQ